MEYVRKDSIGSGSQSILANMLIRPGILKLIHQFLLINYQIEDVWQFWNNHLPGSGNSQRNTRRAFFNTILLSNKGLPIDYVMNVLTAVESFLVNREESSSDFARKLFWNMANAGHGNFAKTVYFWRSTLRKNGVGNVDLRHKIFQSSNRTCRFICRNFHFEIVKESNDRGIFNAVFLFALKTHRGLFSPSFDCAQWVGARVKTLPLMFGLPEYDQVQIISDVRELHEIVPEGTPVTVENSYSSILGVKGEKKSFREFVNRMGLSKLHDSFKAIQTEVMEVLEDYYCPTRKRIVLHKGCVYGAPVYLFKITYAESKPQNPWDALAHIIKTSAKEKELEIRINVLHEKFLMQGGPLCTFLYDKQSNCLFLNGRLLSRNIPAKILSKIIRQYLLDGTTEFERRWLLSDPDIVRDRTNPNLERRIRLVLAAFEHKCRHCCCFSRPTKGMIRFMPKGNITFNEQ
jgi:hypothetical protein